MTTHLPIKLPTSLVARPYIGLRLAEQLTKHAIGQAEIAERVGVSPLTVSRWLKNETRPYPLNVRRLALEFGIEPHQLHDDTQDGTIAP